MASGRPGALSPSPALTRRIDGLVTRQPRTKDGRRPNRPTALLWRRRSPRQEIAVPSAAPVPNSGGCALVAFLAPASRPVALGRVARTAGRFHLWKGAGSVKGGHPAVVLTQRATRSSCKRLYAWSSMGLFDMTEGTLVPVAPTSFAAEGVLERKHLQAALKKNYISLLGDDLLVVAEEFGDFADANRRIDLLCVDREGRPVVIELKRTNEGGHMELQALRYAAMVSAMTFEDLVGIFEKHVDNSEDATGDARERLTSWLDDVGGDEAVVRRDVRLILAAADFGREITTTALWLNDVFGMDIRCVRMTPYRIHDRLLLNVEQVIPLPEAEEITVKLRRREAAARVASTSSADWTPYVVETPAETTEPLRKRRAVLAMVHAVHAAGADPEMIASHLGARFLPVDGSLDGDDLVEAFVAAYPKAEYNRHRWFFSDPVHHGDRTWVLSKMWGTNTEAALAVLVSLVPNAGISYSPARGITSPPTS